MNLSSALLWLATGLFFILSHAIEPFFLMSIVNGSKELKQFKKSKSFRNFFIFIVLRLFCVVILAAIIPSPFRTNNLDFTFTGLFLTNLHPFILPYFIFFVVQQVFASIALYRVISTKDSLLFFTLSAINSFLSLIATALLLAFIGSMFHSLG